MNIDEKIKQELEGAEANFDSITHQQEGLMNMVLGSFQGGLGRWVFVVYFVTLVVSGLMIWSGYGFFTAADLQGQLFWGICLLISLFCQVALKQWAWIEMGRSSILREIKRLEIEVSRLSAKLSEKN